MSPKEQELRQALNIPASAQKVIVFAQAAHMDWDWRNCFQYNVDKSGQACEPSYFNNECVPSNSILQAALNLLQTNSQYWYEVCEMGFLRKFPQLGELKATKRLGIVGGGITSPDSLLPTGEAFFRNYHIGTMWLRSQNIP
jgi:alpha-mannosidase